MQNTTTSGDGAEPELSWLLLARRGDQNAFARLVEAYQAPIFNLAYRMLGNAAEAEDASQEAFVRAYLRLDTYDPARRFSSWILAIAAHHCVDRLRRRRGTVSMEDLPAEGQWLPDQSPRPEDQVIRREQGQAIESLLGLLPAQYRLVIILRYWQDMSYEEIAEMTQTTESAVKSRLHRARQMMAEHMARGPASGASHRVGERKEEHVLSGSF